MRASAKVQRRLFDNAVKINGRLASVVYFEVEEDKYGNEESTIIEKKTIEAVIDFPTQIPIERFKTGNYTLGNSNKTFMFDVLPIELYTKWEDKVTKGDFIIHYLYTEENKKIPIVLELSEFLGSFTTDLVWAKWYCSPYRGILPEPIRLEIESELS